MTCTPSSVYDSPIVTPTDTDMPTPHHAPQPRHSTIPPFFFPFGKPPPPEEKQQQDQKILAVVKHLYGLRPFLLEPHFVAVTKTCGLPRYMNIAFFRRIDSLNSREERVSYDEFIHGWDTIARDRHDDASLLFTILKKPGCSTLVPEDFLPVLEDIVLNHRALLFLAENPIFQERYIETVICRLFYEAKCPSGRMTLAQFRACGFTDMIQALTPSVDLNTTCDCFSYQHFYVLYCKFWALDDDHDLIISESDLEKYSQGALSPRAVSCVMQSGRIAAFARDQGVTAEPSRTLTYLDYIWFLLSENDKSTPTAIEYWFRCMDTDGDGVLSCFELELFWKDQEEKQRFYGVSKEDQIKFDNILSQMNDLIRPKVPGQFRLQDLKRNGFLAERFFDTFLNFERFQIHESFQGSIRAKRKQDLERRDQLLSEELLTAAAEEEITMLEDSLSFTLLSDWCEYAEAEYQQLLLNENADALWDDQDEAEAEAEAEVEVEVEAEIEIQESQQDELGNAYYDTIQQEELDDQDNAQDDDPIQPPHPKDEHGTASQASQQAQQTEDDGARETESISDHDSDTSTPTTPTKIPSPQLSDWTSRGTLDASSQPMVNKQNAWLWQSTDKEQESEDKREDWATEWLRQLSRQRIPNPTPL